MSLSDTTNLPKCKSGEEEEIKKTEVPSSFDWRKAYPGCTQYAPQIPHNCSASHIEATLSAMSDHICAGSNQNTTVRLSGQELLDCPKGTRNCKGGSVNHVLSWGKRKGFVEQSCYPDKETQDDECPVDHVYENDCRVKDSVYKVVDFCLAQEMDGVKREILKNGPVIAQMSVATDFLTYKEGIYHRTQDSFKFPGNHIVKVVGWEMGDEDGGQSYWIAQNVWGSDWGEEGFVKITMGETMLDSFAIGFAAYPMTMADYYAQQQGSQQQQEQMQAQQETINMQAGEEAGEI